jgi:hypothetical protein
LGVAAAPELLTAIPVHWKRRTKKYNELRVLRQRATALIGAFLERTYKNNGLFR